LADGLIIISNKKVSDGALLRQPLKGSQSTLKIKIILQSITKMFLALLVTKNVIAKRIFDTGLMRTSLINNLKLNQKTRISEPISSDSV
jgi:hypothetical protein